MSVVDFEQAPLVPAAAALAAGLAVGPVLGGGATPWLGVAALAGLGAAACTGARRSLLLGLAVVALGAGRGVAGAPEPTPDGRWWTVRVVRAADAPVDRLVVEVMSSSGGETGAWTGRLRAEVRAAGWTAGPVRRGDVLLLRGRLRVGRRGRRVLSVWKPGHACVLPGGAGPPVLAGPASAGWRDRGDLALEGARTRVGTAVERGATPRTRGLLRALALGDRRGVGPRLRQAFARTGTAHLVAISGLHVGCFYAALLAGLRPLLRRGPWPLRWKLEGHPDRAAAVLALAGAAAYVVLAGAPISARRALVMLACVCAASLADRAPSSGNALAAAVIVVGWTDPPSVGQLGFQLSVASVAGLIWFVPGIGSGGGRGGWYVRRVLQALVASTVATAATAPLIGRVWGSVPAAGVWANPVVVPVLGAATVPVLLFGAALAVIEPSLGVPFVRLAAGIAELGLALVDVLARPELSPMIAWRPGPSTVAGAYLAAGAVLLAWAPPEER
ncbi:MAG: ComEC/Rec2 family competence protein [Proteobacteria bacterium]|nr:ComEC/Rec2 family competence protein [Pseudomonadota bacterium]